MFTSKFLVRILAAMLVLFVVQSSAAPISLHSREESSELAPSSGPPPIPPMDSPFFPWNAPKDATRPEAKVGVTEPTKSPEADKINQSTTTVPVENGHQNYRSFMSTHPALVICLFILAPFVLCLAIYPVVRYYKRRRNQTEAPQVVQDPEATASDESADQSFDSEDKDPATPPSKHPRQVRIHVDPFPEFPGLVYVPPTPQEGTRPIFGHFVDPYGQVLGVKNTWTLAVPRDGANNA